MCALASLPARAAARVRRIEAEAPALAAAATCPVGLIVLLNPIASPLLTIVFMPDLIDPECVNSGLTLREARYMYNESDSRAVADMLASWLRRLAWSELLALPPLGREQEEALIALPINALQTLCIMCAPALPATAFWCQLPRCGLKVRRDGVLCEAQADQPLPHGPWP